MIEVENRTMEMLPYKNQIPVLSGRIRADRLQVIFSISYINAKTGRLIGTVALQNLEKRRMDTYELKAEHAGHLLLDATTLIHTNPPEDEATYRMNSIMRNALENGKIRKK